MGSPILASQPRSHRSPITGGGGSPRRGAQPLRRRAFPRREQTEDLSAARRQDPIGVHVHYPAEIRSVLFAGN